MAIIKMKKLRLIGLLSEQVKIMEHLQRLGTLDISPSSENIPPPDTEFLSSALHSELDRLGSAIEILSEYSQEKSGFFKVHPLAKENFPTERALKISTEVLDIRDRLEENSKKLLALNAEKSTLSPYLRADVPLNFSSTSSYTEAGMFEKSYTKDTLQNELAEAGLSEVYFEILFSGKLSAAVWFMAHRSLKAELNRFLQERRFSEFTSLSLKTPVEQKNIILNDIGRLKSENDSLFGKMKKLSEKLDFLKLSYDMLSAKLDRLRAFSKSGVTETTFFIEGYIPEEAVMTVKSSIEKRFSAVIFTESTKEGDDVPKAFKNNAFVEPVEGITYDFSPPASTDIDPNPIMSFFYYLFFGMMFSDAGYGLLMTVFCAVLGYGNFIEKERRHFFRMFFFCGISTAFWGLMYGSFFGDLVSTLSTTFGTGRLALKPLLFDPVKKPLELLLISITFGFLHILTALSAKFYNTWRAGRKKEAVFDTLSWIVLFLGTALFISGAKAIGIALTASAVLTLILTQGREKKNPFAKLFSGILSLYGITGYVGDLLSYSRLMALGLATGVIASVVNVLASLGGKSITGVILFIIISLVGHSLNFAINMLGAYVHTNRLQYVEFYQKFYEGGGRRYRPFCYNTKYYRFH